MLNIWDIFHAAFWPVVLLVSIILFATVAIVVVVYFFGKPERDLSVYVKKPFIFDNKTEFELFKILVDLFGGRYYIFPQVGYSHILEVRKGLPERVRFGYWNSINRKSADFVLCDKEQVAPQLVIELDGSSHQLPKRMERDDFINELMKVAALPILHLKTDNFDRVYVKGEVEKALNLETSTLS